MTNNLHIYMRTHGLSAFQMAEKFKKQADILAEALRFYADECRDRMAVDHGKRATDILKTYEEQK